MDITSLSDERLAAEAAREGSDGPAFVELLERYQQRIWQVCFRLLGNAEDAHDAAQEVLVRMFLHRATFEGRSKYSTWAHGIALRTCLSLRRGRGRRQRRETKAGEQAGHRQARLDRARREQPVHEVSLDLQRMLEGLDEEDRAMLIMKYAEGHGYDDLSQMFDMSVSACKMRISRAREKLRKTYPEHSAESPDQEG